MEAVDLLSLVEHLEDNIDDLEENLEPLLSTALSLTTKKLPVLDNAKLYVLIVYSVESILFSYLRLNGVHAKEHAVFRELIRVKQYFEKIKGAEAGPTKSRENLSLNKQATGRIIKHALAGNAKYDTERAEREAREKLLAKNKLRKALEDRLEKFEESLKEEGRNAENGHSGSESDGGSDDDTDEDKNMTDSTPRTAGDSTPTKAVRDSQGTERSKLRESPGPKASNTAGARNPGQRKRKRKRERDGRGGVVKKPKAEQNSVG